MNRIDKDELFGHVRNYLKVKGVELQEGPYTRTVQMGCHLLAESINLSQQAMERAKTEIERAVDQARQVIHEKTAPKPPPANARSKKTASSGQKEPGRTRKSARRPKPSVS